MTTKDKGAGNPPPIAKLSAEDQAIITRWRAEVGDETLRRIAAAVAARSPGRPTTVDANEPLLRQMAEASRRNPTCSAFALARDVASTAEGRREARRRYIQIGGLAKTLQRQWAQHRMRLMREAARRADAPTSIYDVLMAETLSPRALEMFGLPRTLPPAVAEHFENMKKMSALIPQPIALPPGILPPRTKPT